LAQKPVKAIQLFITDLMTFHSKFSRQSTQINITFSLILHSFRQLCFMKSPILQIITFHT